MRSIICTTCFLLITTLLSHSTAQEAIKVGSGSYASFPPADIATWDAGLYSEIQAMLNHQTYIVDTNTRPIPTNNWWTDMLNKEAPGDEFGGINWAYPITVNPESWGVRAEVMTQWHNGGHFALAVGGAAVEVRGVNFTPAKSLVRNWGDWTFDFIMPESATKYMAVTLGHGLPLCWVECFNVAVQLQFAGVTEFFNAAGAALTLPLTTDHFGVTVNGTPWGIFLPPGSQIARQDGAVTVQFPAAASGYVVMAALSAKQDLQTMGEVAWNVPRNSRIHWNYHSDRGELTTRWELTLENLRGQTANGTIMGWLPHQTRTTRRSFAFNTMHFETPRGRMQCARGSSFEISWPFEGILPRQPAPGASGTTPAGYDDARMRDMVRRYAAITFYDIETYAGAIGLQKFARYLDMAHELGMSAEFTALKNTLRTALTDWFTWTPGEKQRYFCYYPNWKALVGIRPAFGSQSFIDQHFHYGHFVYAAGVLAMHDADFATQYGPMAKMVAREYANWIHGDNLLPFMRTFDIWVGNSCASGLGNSGGGQNQESHSEAMNAWTGLYLLGVATGDTAARNAGIFGWVQEGQAGVEYVFDMHRENHPPQFTHPVATQMWHNQFVYATHFDQMPVWKHAILWTPVGPGSGYLTTDTAFARWQYDTMWTEQRALHPDSRWNSWPENLANTVLQFKALFDPAGAAVLFDSLWQQQVSWIRQDNYTGITYYQLHAQRALGAIARGWHTSLPTGQVFRAADGTLRFCVLNPAAQAVEVTVYQGDAPRYRFSAAPRSLTTKPQGEADVVSLLHSARQTAAPRQFTLTAARALSPLRLACPDGPATVTIHDLTGAVIRTLDVRDAGIFWDGRSTAGRHCSAGTYLVSLAASGGRTYGSLVLLR